MDKTVLLLKVHASTSLHGPHMSYFTNNDLVHTSSMMLKYIINVDESGVKVSMIIGCHIYVYDHRYFNIII